MLRTLAFPTLLAFGLLASACGASQNTGVREASFTQSVVPTPTLTGTPVPVCERLALQGVVSSSSVLEDGVVFEIAALDPALRARIRAIAADDVAAIQNLEARFQSVHAVHDDVGSGVFVRFTADESETLDALAETLQRGINRRSAAARRVSILREDGYVDMQMPNGGPLITSKTSEAARETVQKWTNRTPTPVSMEDTQHGVRIVVGTRDADRLDDLRERFLHEVFACEERPETSPSVPADPAPDADAGSTGSLMPLTASDDSLPSH